MQPSAYFLIGLFVYFDIKLYMLFVYFQNQSVDSIICKYFLSICRLSFCFFFYFVYSFLCCAKAFKINQAPFVYFCFISITLGDESPQNCCLSQRVLQMCFLQELYSIQSWCSYYEEQYGGIHPEKTIIWKDTCTPMFKATLFARAKMRKQPKCSPTDEQAKEMQWKPTPVFLCR